jgi:hypothetical protein
MTILKKDIDKSHPTYPWWSIQHHNEVIEPKLIPKVPKITIEDGADYFAIVIDKERFDFSQEDGEHRKLVKVLAKLGFKAKYKEIY